MRIETRAFQGEKRVHGPCHRCGWVADVTRINRRQANQLNLGSHAARICDECLDELQRGPVESVESVPDVRMALRAPSRRQRVVA